MAKKPQKHQSLYEYDTIKNIAKTYKKPVTHIAAIMQKKNITSIGLFYDDFLQFEQPVRNNTITPTEHIPIPFSYWKNYKFNSKEGFLYGVANHLKTNPDEDFRAGFRDIYIHKEEFRKKSSLIKTEQRLHAHLSIIKELYFEFGQNKRVSPNDFIEELYNKAGEDERIAAMSGMDKNDTITFCTQAGAYKDVKVKTIKTRVSLFNKDMKKAKP